MEHTLEICLALGVFAPFVSFWVLVLFGPRLGKPLSGWTGVVLGMLIPFLLSSYVLFSWYGLSPAQKAEMTANAFRFEWAALGSVPITVGVKLDSLTIGMFFMVTLIALNIFVFSVGYMSGHSDEVAGQRKYWRFFAYLSLFAFSMLGLVISSSLLFLFIFWELVGLCSYLLIGFYFDKPTPQYAQMKAFITNRVGDFGFLIGLMLVFTYLGTLDLDEAAKVFAAQAATGEGIFASTYTLFGWGLATIMGVGLFCGAMGKSAQFPLHVWLPDAMAGPTPVSALIHAATMVAAGVYLVARVYRLMTPEALMFISLIGCLTLTLMALIAVVQTDIKKCLAYSTLSQLGYMVFGMGCGAWVAALFHLITHAFFKAMMFLGSGQVIEGCHHEQDMRKMGGLIRKMPVTGFTFLLGVLAIAGTGLPGVHIGNWKFGLGGFFSKDEILAVAYARSHVWGPENADKYEEHHGDGHGHGHGGHDDHGDHGGHSSIAPVTGEKVAMLVADPKPGGKHGHDDHGHGKDDHGHAGHGHKGHGHDGAHGDHAHGGHGHDDHGHGKAALIGTIPALPKWMFFCAIFTAYITPFYMMRCWWLTFMGKPRDKHVHDHAHESPLMFLPLVVLAVGTVISSYFPFRQLIVDAAGAATQAPLVLAIDGESHSPAIHEAHEWLVFGVGFAFAIGFALAIGVYRSGLGFAESIRRLPIVSQIHMLLDRKYFIDEIYDIVWIKGCLVIARISSFIDKFVVDYIFLISAWLTRIFASLSGLVDKHGVDGVVNGVADFSRDTGDALRRPQTGRIRNYVLFATGAAAIVFVLLIVFGLDSSTPPATTAESSEVLSASMAP